MLTLEATSSVVSSCVSDVYVHDTVVGTCAIKLFEKTACIALADSFCQLQYLPNLIERSCLLFDPDSVYCSGRLLRTLPVGQTWEKTAEDTLYFPTLTFEKIAKETKEQLVSAYMHWRKQPTKQNMGQVVNTLQPFMNRELHVYRGTLPENVLRSHAKKIAINAVKNYDSNKGTALSTHLIHQLQQLHRKNYESFGTLRIPEHLQRGVGGYLRATEHLRSNLGREPTAAEVADEMNWNIRHIQQMEKQLRNEVTDNALEFDPAAIQFSPNDAKVDYFYYDLPPAEQKIFEHTTGYAGKTILPKKDIASMLNMSSARISQKSSEIASRFKKVFS